jgi:hypothetical protein
MAYAINKITITNHKILPNFEWCNIPQLILLNLKLSNNTQISGIAIEKQINENEYGYGYGYGYVPWQQNLGSSEVGNYSNIRDKLVQ